MNTPHLVLLVGVNMSLYKKKLIGIYALEWDDAIYVGSSINIMNRWHAHLTNPSTNNDLTAAICKELPTFKILHLFDKKTVRSELLKFEQLYINKYVNTNRKLLNKRHKVYNDKPTKITSKTKKSSK